ncbi:hypothetical protein Vadar_027572 [Vaccinium darrowii]|uniref:Uncharacterized protein n=1 Tax=Vaccinium darrowii TaxID=229202 RepID=A0ACB7YZQ8_9ERIC|nr:hypothetical protein Vadar_027572 [Vaccinium darrowii]
MALHDHDYTSYESEFATAIAAAAFAIHSAEEANSEYRKKLRSMSRAKRRKDDLEARRIPGNEAKDPEVESSMKKRMEQDRRGRASFAGHAGGDESQRESSRRRRRRSPEAKANTWEKPAMAKLVKRYEKMNSNILAWENEKKMKAKVEMERTKRELEQRNAVNLQHYRNEIARIEHVAGGTRVQLEDKRRNEETKVKERAKRRIRTKGKFPFSCCFCF